MRICLSCLNPATNGNLCARNYFINKYGENPEYVWRIVWNLEQERNWAIKRRLKKLNIKTKDLILALAPTYPCKERKTQSRDYFTCVSGAAPTAFSTPPACVRKGEGGRQPSIPPFGLPPFPKELI